MTPATRLDLNRLELKHLPCLGSASRLQYRQAWFRIQAAALLAHPLSQGEFLLMCVTATAQQALQAPWVLLRVADWEAPAQGPVPNDNPGLLDSLLRCDILGSFEPGAQNNKGWHFSGQIRLDRAAQAHPLYMPTPALLQQLINATLPTQGLLALGCLRPNEQTRWAQQALPAWMAMDDMVCKRTAMLGKTRYGKSNIVKLIVQGMLDHTAHSRHVGQLLFDVSGEYANTEPATGQITLASHNRDRCMAYHLNEKQGQSGGRLLRFNFYQTPEVALDVMRELLPATATAHDPLRSLLTCRLPLPSKNTAHSSEPSVPRALRKIMLFWTTLSAAGYVFDADRIKAWLIDHGMRSLFNPGFAPGLRQTAYLAIHNRPAPALPSSMASLLEEMQTMAKFRMTYANDPQLMPNGRPLFDAEEDILMRMVCDDSGRGPEQMRGCLPYHSAQAEDFTTDVVQALNQGRTVIVDLSNAAEAVVRYFAHKLCVAIFAEQETKFRRNALSGHYVQIYFEEAHTLFSQQETAMNSVYARFAKEGAKFHIGIVYATQSPSTLLPDLLAQTENFFVGHLSSQIEVETLCQLQLAFQGCENAIRYNRTPGLVQMLTHSHRFVVPIQAQLYEGRPLLVA